MTSSIAQENCLWHLLTSNQVENIQTTIFINVNPNDTTLPATLHPEAEELLKKLQGRIFPIALRGKSQAGKSTTLNRIAKITNFPMQTLLPIGENFGSTTTYGIWLMIITFKNRDALLLFDVQGTGHGADEVTYKLIAFTDHICTKVIDVFRMPFPEGFSNEYIDTLCYLAMGRDSVKNLTPTSNKAILWTACALPKQSPLEKKNCKEPEEYHIAILHEVKGERTAQAEKAKKYTEQTPILTTEKPCDEIISKISQLDNAHPFIKENLISTIQNILSNVPSAKIGSCEIKGTHEYVQYLQLIYDCIIKCNINLPFCQSVLIKSIAVSNLNEQKRWIDEQLQQMKQNYSENWDWIENNAKHEIDNSINQCIQQFENALNSLTRDYWEEHLQDLRYYIGICTKELIDHFKISIIGIFVPKKYLELHHLCTLGDTSDTLKDKLNKKKSEIIKQLYDIPLFNGNMNNTQKLVEQGLENRIDELYHIQKSIEQHWFYHEEEFKKKIYEPNQDEIDQAIDNIIQNLTDFSSQEFKKFNIIPKIFFDRQKTKQDLKQRNNDRAKQMIEMFQRKYISEFNLCIESVLLMDTIVQTKYEKLMGEKLECQKQYYKELGSPLNDYSIGDMDKQLKQKLDEALDRLYTPDVQEKLKNDRIAQMEYLAKFTREDQESLTWVHCIGCQRIFAGRTKGCKNVECDYQENDNYIRGKKTEHVCGLTFEWKKAQPVDFKKLPEEFWLTPTETRGIISRARGAITDAGTVIRNTSQRAGTIILDRSQRAGTIILDRSQRATTAILATSQRIYDMLSTVFQYKSV